MICLKSQDFHYKLSKKMSELSLQPFGVNTLSFLQQLGIQQSVLSAGLQSDVEKFLNSYDLTGLGACGGVDNVNAEGKEIGSWSSGEDCLRSGGGLLVGDTMLDDKIAHLLSVNGLLVTNGHNSPQALNNSKSSRIPSLSFPKLAMLTTCLHSIISYPYAESFHQDIWVSNEREGFGGGGIQTSGSWLSTCK